MIWYNYYKTRLLISAIDLYMYIHNIYQHCFAELSRSHIKREFSVKSCGGPTQVGKLGSKSCANISH